MPQWAYCSLKLTGTDLYYIQYLPNQTPPSQHIDPDPLVDPHLTSTLRRWIAQLGADGWELTTAFTDNIGQELIFKQPIP